MPRPKMSKNQEKYKFARHEVVWAKITGYPWWPAVITDIHNLNYKVDFLGDRTYSYLPESKIAKYEQFREEFQSSKKHNKHFTNAVSIAARRHAELLEKKASRKVAQKPSEERKTSQQKQQLNEQNRALNVSRISQLQCSEPHEHKQGVKLISVPTEQKSRESKETQLEQESHSSMEAKIPAQVRDAKDASIEPIVEEVSVQQKVEKSAQFQQNLKERLVHFVLAKYKLDCLDELKEKRSNHRRGQIVEDSPQQKSPKVHWKKRLIAKGKKNGSNKKEAELTEQQLQTRKIYKNLRLKVSIDSAKLIALKLSVQVAKKKGNKLDFLMKLLSWISASSREHIQNYYEEWVNFHRDHEREREKEKYSSMTNESHSEQIPVGEK